MLILDSKGDTVRNFKAEVDTGLTKIYWNMNRNGLRWPSRSERKDDADPPGGERVMPGTYRARFTLGKDSTETSVRVNPDPREPFSAEQWDKREKLRAELEEIIAKADKGFESLKKAKSSLNLVEENLKLLEKADADSVRADIKSLKKQLAELEELYMLAEDFEGYDHVTERLNDLLGNASSYLGSYASGVGSNAENSIALASKETERVLQEINQFFEEHWNPFSEKMSAITFKPVSAFEKIE